jgi:predicted DNA-binding protein
MGDNGKEAQYTKPTGFRLSPVIKEKLAKVAVWEGIDMAAVVRESINEKYSENKAEIEAYLAEHPEALEKVLKYLK